MTALDIYRDCSAIDERIERVREKIERRRALASGCTARPLSPDGGGHGGGDASMRLLEQLADIQTMEAELAELEGQREQLRSCCLYLSDMMARALASVALQYYLEHKGYQAIAEDSHYGLTTVKRYKRYADEALRSIEIIHWDGRHTPMVSIH